MDKYVPVMWEMISEIVLLITNSDATYFPPSVKAKWAYNEASVLSGLSNGSQPSPRSLVKMHIVWLSGTADGNRKQPIIQNHRHLFSALKIKISCTFMHIFYFHNVFVTYGSIFSSTSYFKNGMGRFVYMYLYTFHYMGTALSLPLNQTQF